MSELQVHPVADLFPMLADDELAELAEDIKQRGLLQPIVLDPDGRVLDGRNRLAACELAGIKPRFETFSGDDPDGFAWSVNVKRRSLTKAQVAVMAADRFAGKDLPVREVAEAAGVSHPMVVWAQTVRPHQDLHDGVLGRTKSLTDAYAEAQKRDAAEVERRAKLDRLRTGAPDLLALVEEERMTIDDADAALTARLEKARQDEAAEEARRKAARQEALNAWNQFNDALTAALSYAKTYAPPEDTDIYATIAKVRKRTEELAQIVDSWKDPE